MDFKYLLLSLIRDFSWGPSLLISWMAPEIHDIPLQLHIQIGSLRLTSPSMAWLYHLHTHLRGKEMKPVQFKRLMDYRLHGAPTAPSLLPHLGSVGKRSSRRPTATKFAKTYTPHSSKDTGRQNKEKTENMTLLIKTSFIVYNLHFFQIFKPKSKGCVIYARTKYYFYFSAACVAIFGTT